MFPVIHGILAQAREGESCVYPLDVTPETLALLGYEAFNVHDKCGHNLSSSGKGSHSAISQAVAEAIISGTQFPNEDTLPPSYLGDGIYAVEFSISAEMLEEKLGGVFLSIGGTDLLDQEGSRYGSARITFANFGQGIVGTIFSLYDENNDEVYREIAGKLSVRVGAYFNTITGRYGYIFDGEDLGYLGPYTVSPTYVLFVKQFVNNPEETIEANVSINVRTKGKDLTFTYPEGTKGLDGQPAPMPTTIGEFIGGGLYAGDINIGDEDYAIIVAASDAGNPSLKWKLENTTTPGTGNIKDGRANTNAIIADGIEAHPAAEHCVNWRGGGHDDWYLGSQAEWTEINKNRNINNLWSELALPAIGYIWSSTQSTSSGASSMGASSGGWFNSLKTNEYAVRPIRRIKL